MPVFFGAEIATLRELVFPWLVEMPPISAILQTHNDGLRLGRALETLHPCSEIVIVDRGSTDGTLGIAREYGARIVSPRRSSAEILRYAKHDWLLWLLPNEALSEGLEASLYEWHRAATEDLRTISSASARVREETEQGWSIAPLQTRLIPKTWVHWDGMTPAHDSQSSLLQGDLLHFRLP